MSLDLSAIIDCRTDWNNMNVAGIVSVLGDQDILKVGVMNDDLVTGTPNFTKGKSNSPISKSSGNA
jgi:hypothetical protein